MLNTILWIIAVIAFIWVTYDVLANQKSMSGGKKAMWIILAFLFSIITAIVYIFVRKK